MIHGLDKVLIHSYQKFAIYTTIPELLYHTAVAVSINWHLF